MPYPFLKEHDEKQYLELETKFLNLFGFLQSLLSITEGEDLESNNQKIIQFGALCMRINQAVDEYQEFASKVRDVMFKGDSATTTSETEPTSNVLIRCNKQEYSLIIESLEHMANSFPALKIADEFQAIADDIKNLKTEEVKWVKKKR